MKTDSVVRARTPTMTTTTTGAHVTVGVQELVSTFVITRTEATPNTMPRPIPVTLTVIACQPVMDSSCLVVAPTRLSSRSESRRPTVAMTRVLTRVTAARIAIMAIRRLFA
jgi:hypothetical protein